MAILSEDCMRQAGGALPQSDLQIGQAAALSGVSAKMIRYYESVGLIRPAARSAGNYRTYDENAVQILRFIARARGLGFSMSDITRLLELWQEPARSSADVKALALKHIAELDEKIRALADMRAALWRLTDHCHGDARPACPILEKLAGETVALSPSNERGRCNG